MTHFDAAVDLEPQPLCLPLILSFFCQEFEVASTKKNKKKKDKKAPESQEAAASPKAPEPTPAPAPAPAPAHTSLPYRGSGVSM